MKMSIRWGVAAMVLALGLAFAGMPSPALAISQSQAANKVALAFDVQVLRVRAGEVEGTPVWLVTVMNRGGDFNSAFQVNTLAVDQQSGELRPAFRHRSSGYKLSAAPVNRESRLAR